MRAETVVVGYDGSANARQALDAAVQVLDEGGTVHVVTAFDKPSVRELNQALSALPEEFRGSIDILAQPEQYLHEAELHLREAGVGPDACEGHLVDDSPADAILEVADAVDADLIVVGSRGLGRVTRFVRGSVSSRIANYATVNLLIVHEDA